MNNTIIYPVILMLIFAIAGSMVLRTENFVKTSLGIGVTITALLAAATTQLGLYPLLYTFFGGTNMSNILHVSTSVGASSLIGSFVDFYVYIFACIYFEAKQREKSTDVMNIPDQKVIKSSKAGMIVLALVSAGLSFTSATGLSAVYSNPESKLVEKTGEALNVSADIMSPIQTQLNTILNEIANMEDAAARKVETESPVYTSRAKAGIVVPRGINYPRWYQNKVSTILNQNDQYANALERKAHYQSQLDTAMNFTQTFTEQAYEASQEEDNQALKDSKTIKSLASNVLYILGPGFTLLELFLIYLMATMGYLKLGKITIIQKGRMFTSRKQGSRAPSGPSSPKAIVERPENPRVELNDNNQYCVEYTVRRSRKGLKQGEVVWRTEDWIRKQVYTNRYKHRDLTENPTDDPSKDATSLETFEKNIKLFEWYLNFIAERKKEN